MTTESAAPAEWVGIDVLVPGVRYTPDQIGGDLTNAESIIADMRASGSKHAALSDYDVIQEDVTIMVMVKHEDGSVTRAEW